MNEKIEGKNEITGIYAQGKGDFGFVDVEGHQKGYFVFGRNSLNAMPGDTVTAIIKEYKGKEEAEITRVLERRKEPIVGVYNDSGRFGFVTPHNPTFQQDIFVPGSKSFKAKDGEIVAVEVIRWQGKSPEGKVVKVLGQPGEKGVDVLGLAVEYGARMGFGGSIREELGKVSKDISEKDIKNRKDLRELFTITIDGEDSKDLDDAISLEQNEKGNYILSVHIADVAHYVKEGHAIDKEALKRGTSIYLVDQVIPMLPEELSNGLCSLNPNEDKLTLTCEIEINSAGHIVNTEVYESVVKSNFRMTYKEVDEIVLSSTIGAELLFGGIVSQKLVSMLQDSEKLRGILAQYKKTLGVLDFDFPETKIVVDKNGNPTEFKKYERYNSNKIIEEFMVMANEAISKKFAQVPFLYRVHPKPSDEDVEKLHKSLAVFGYTLPITDTVNSKDFSKVLHEIKKDAREKLLSKMVLRSLTKAIYSEEREGHFGLALDYYSHFTSPIRRYPDLQIHRIIKEKLAGKLDEGRIAHYKLILTKVANKTSDLEVKAEKLSYKIQDLMAVKFMKDKVGQKFDAHISGAIQYGVFVELENTIEGFVELNEKFGPSNFVFNADMMEMKSSVSQVKYSIGDSVKVELIKVDDKLLRLDFALVL